MQSLHPYGCTASSLSLRPAHDPDRSTAVNDGAAHTNGASPLRVAFFHQSADLYGSDKVLLDLVRRTQRLGVAPLVVLPLHGPLTAELERSSIPVHIAPVCKIERASMSPKGMLGLIRSSTRSLDAIDRIIDASRVDLVHSNTLAVLGGALWARRHAIPHVWHVHEILLRPALARKGFPLMLRMLADTIVCNSEATRRWVTHQQRATAARTVTIWNGVEAPPDPGHAPAIRPPSHVPDGPPVVIGLVGRLNHWKGQELLLKAAERAAERGLGGFAVWFVGSAVEGQEQMRDSLLTRIEASPLRTRVRLMEFQRDIWPIWRSVDIACVPSTLPEPFGMVAIEAMSIGKPVIAAAHGGLLEIVQDGQNGLLFQPNDVEALANCLTRMVSDEQSRRQYGEAARETVRAKFSAETTARSMIQCYQRTIATARMRS